MTFAYHHPNYYKKVKKEAASFKPEAPSAKPQAPSVKRSVRKIPEPRSTNRQ